MNWKGLEGHTQQKLGMERILRSGRLGQAYLLTGPDGVGKRLFARKVGAALLCLRFAKTPADGPCGECESCRLLTGETHPDLLETKRPADKQEFPIQVMKEFCDLFYLKPMTSGRKVAIIDDADDLNTESANCFLKTLEEPPAGMVVFLVGNRIERQLPTIISRCQQIAFGPLEPAVLARLADPETAADPSWELAVTFSEGSMNQAQAFADPTLWDLVQRTGKLLARESRHEAGLAKDLQEWIESAGKDGVHQRPKALSYLKAASLLLTQALNPASVAGSLGSRFPFLRKLSAAADPSVLIKIVDRLGRAGEMVERRIPLSLGMAWLVEEMHQVLEGKA